MKSLMFALSLTCLTVTSLTVTSMPIAAQAADLITKTSAHDVGTTVDRLVAAVEGAGAKVFARIDHAAGAKNVGMSIPANQVLMFGNPKLGTPAIQASQTAGLDLPLRVVVYQGEGGKVFLSYHDPVTLHENHGVPSDAMVLKKMTGALDKLTGKAVSE